MNAALVILAAGDSRRLGTPKQLVRIAGRTLLRHAALEACASTARDVIVVLGSEAPRMREELRGLRSRVVENSAWREGIASSIHAGCDAVDASADGVLIALCDQPHISAAHIDALIRAGESSPASAVASFYGGSPGVPAWFPRALFGDLLALRGDRGAKQVLAAPGGRLVTIAWPAGLLDIDTAEDIPAAV
ncbi:MAG TPA: nucleotidyltransferase family protein [Bacteroidota bacterium]|nr:nucleotidyltransferase family protein [Bacteroidota bacterium]